ncbi:MAG: UDP-N-acetylglucosamine 4,6-dehydratase (inverting) [Candidatus Caenarcaniphilales bacterium]|nr:UDP-N-acetylglucosamine 4,6-dehydratase (inverting) [Candidatus Caenarcaniphilales bacterium]
MQKKLGYKSFLITGGTGSFGQALTGYLLENFADQIERLVIYSRDEYKQSEMSQKFSQKEYPQIRYFLGDVRDEDRLMKAFYEVEVIIHAAALKQVPATEYNPFECIKTNVLGAQNIINAALKTNIKKVVALSTDKAAAPINLYGATKLCSDKLFVAANAFALDMDLAVVRYGNVMCSRGSVIPFFLKQRETGVIPITHEDMTRFNITLDNAVENVMLALYDSFGGEIFVPKLPSYRILDLAKAIAPDCEHKLIGLRAGEKIHEEMITRSDSHQTYDFDDHYRILPYSLSKKLCDYIEASGAKKVSEYFSYNSGDNDVWLSPEELRTLISDEVGYAI